MLPPSIFLDFADATYLDPRLTFSRASSGCYADRLGVLRYRPANTARFWTSPGDGSPGGLLLEAAATNLLLWSEDFTNVAWTTIGATMQANQAAAPDGSPNADLMIATDGTAAVAQSATITVNNGLALSVFAKAGTGGFVSLSLNDGQNVVSAWFNLTNGTVGSTLLGSGTLTYQWASIEAWGQGWYRCGLQAKTNTNTTIGTSVSPAHADRTAPSNLDGVYLWGAMLSQEGTNANSSRQSSYISTGAATATRALDAAILLNSKLEASQFNINEGSYFLDFIVPPGTWQTFWGTGFGFGTNGGDTCLTGLTVGFNALGKMFLAVQTSLVAGGASRAVATNYPAFTFGSPIKIAVRYSRTGLLGQSTNGGAIVSSAAIPAVWFASNPFGFVFSLVNGLVNGNAISALIIRRFAYFPRYLSPDQMQQLTA